MSDDIFQKALERCEQLERELDELRKFIKKYQELNGEVKTVSVAATMRIEARQADHSNKSVPDIAFDICQQFSRPIPVSELVQIIHQRGRKIGGKDPKINLSSMLCRDTRFENIRGRGWKLAESKSNEALRDKAQRPA